jgi:RNA polymerase sigma-70 factor (ECF subfamily)
VRDLTAAIARGDTAAFARFYESWFERAFALARSVTRKDESFCLDVVQDCMLKAARKLGPLPDERALSAWMARAILSTAIDLLRREERRARRERAAAVPEADTSTPEPADERADWLRAALELLPPADRMLFEDRFVAGKTLAAAGAAAGISGDAAHGRIWRILARLRRAAQERFGD